MPRSLLLSDACEWWDEKNGTCGGRPFSLSIEHGEIVYCRKHYEDWLALKNVYKAQSVLAGLTSDEKKILIKGMRA